MFKNKFLTFLLSIIPGCGFMYLGYMKRGLQIMAMFIASSYLAFAVVEMFNYHYTFLAVFFILLLPLIWFYQMFDSMHRISLMKKSAIEVPDDDGFFFPQSMNINVDVTTFFKNRTFNKVIAVILIIVGSYSILTNVLRSLINITERYVIQEVFNSIYYGIEQYLIPTIISVVLVIVGIKLLRWQKPRNDFLIDDTNENDSGEER